MICLTDLYTVEYKFIGQMTDLHIRVILRSSKLYASIHVTTGMNHDMIWLTCELVLRTEERSRPNCWTLFSFQFHPFYHQKRDETRKLLVRAKCIIRRLVNTLFSDKTVRLTGLNRNWRSKFMSSETFDNFRGTLLKSFINRNVFKVRFN